MTASTEITWGATTDRGLKRAVNEDSFLTEPPIFLVADGMGGHEAGAEASRAAIESYRELASLDEITDEALEAAFTSAVQRVSDIVVVRGAAGTTLTGFIPTMRTGQAYWLVLNIGDSRVYRLTQGHLEQISVDHSAVQELVERGSIRAEDAEKHPERSVITRAIGAGSEAAADYWLVPARPGDRMLACSDGLSKELTPAHIERVLSEEATAQAAATRLVHEALLHGGRDNVTAVVVFTTGENTELDLDETVPTP